MYSVLLTIHSALRWLVLLALILAICRACRGLFHNITFTLADNASRHWTATIAHIQLTVGIILYIKSPVVHFYLNNESVSNQNFEGFFFGLVHITLMAIAVVILTIGSGLAKRKSTSKEKYRTMLIWFGASLLIIIVSIPWPFSPLASRPYLRTL